MARKKSDRHDPWCTKVAFGVFPCVLVGTFPYGALAQLHQAGIEARQLPASVTSGPGSRARAATTAGAYTPSRVAVLPPLPSRAQNVKTFGAFFVPAKNVARCLAARPPR